MNERRQPAFNDHVEHVDQDGNMNDFGFRIIEEPDHSSTTDSSQDNSTETTTLPITSTVSPFDMTDDNAQPKRTRRVFTRRPDQ